MFAATMMETVLLWSVVLDLFRTFSDHMFQIFYDFVLLVRLWRWFWFFAYQQASIQARICGGHRRIGAFRHCFSIWYQDVIKFHQTRRESNSSQWLPESPTQNRNQPDVKFTKWSFFMHLYQHKWYYSLCIFKSQYDVFFRFAIVVYVVLSKLLVMSQAFCCGELFCQVVTWFC